MLVALDTRCDRRNSVYSLKLSNSLRKCQTTVFFFSVLGKNARIPSVSGKIRRYAIINRRATYSCREYSPLARNGKREKERKRGEWEEREAAIIVHQIVFLVLDTRFKTQSAALVRDRAARNHDQIHRSPRRSYRRAQKPSHTRPINTVI